MFLLAAQVFGDVALVRHRHPVKVFEGEVAVVVYRLEGGDSVHPVERALLEVVEPPPPLPLRRPLPAGVLHVYQMNVAFQDVQPHAKIHAAFDNHVGRVQYDPYDVGIAAAH